MASDWIKVIKVTPDKPEVMRIARRLGIDVDAAMGKLVRVWAWADDNSVDGVVDGVVDADVDRVGRQDGLATAMVEVGWLTIDAASERVIVPNFPRHNGESSKKRALKSERQARWRDGLVDAPSYTDATTREEKRREEKKRTPRSPPDGGDPAFAQFWSAYPKKVGKDKAVEAFKRLRSPVSTLEHILKALAWQTQSVDWSREGGRFIPNPATYLNQGRWQDEPTDKAPAYDLSFIDKASA